MHSFYIKFVSNWINIMSTIYFEFWTVIQSWIIQCYPILNWSVVHAKWYPLKSALSLIVLFHGWKCMIQKRISWNYVDFIENVIEIHLNIVNFIFNWCFIQFIVGRDYTHPKPAFLEAQAVNTVILSDKKKLKMEKICRIMNLSYHTSESYRTLESTGIDAMNLLVLLTYSVELFTERVKGKNSEYFVRRNQNPKYAYIHNLLKNVCRHKASTKVVGCIFCRYLVLVIIWKMSQKRCSVGDLITWLL